MGGTATLIAISYSVVCVVGVLVAWFVYRSTRHPGIPTSTRALARFEGNWLVIVSVALVALLLSTIFFIPYGQSAPAASSQTVRVTAQQFAWQVQPARIRAGMPTQFLATSTDVNHGFGVYEHDGPLVFQIQVVPGRTQRVVHTFTRPGTYEVLCLEFCGVGHHRMLTTFEVVAPTGDGQQ